MLTQSFLKLVLEPVQEQRRLIGQVAHALLFYANVMPAESVRVNDALGEGTVTVGANPEEVEEARKALRGLAGELRAARTGSVDPTDWQQKWQQPISNKRRRQ